jgi:hyaluronan synthase
MPTNRPSTLPHRLTRTALVVVLLGLCLTQAVLLLKRFLAEPQGEASSALSTIPFLLPLTQGLALVGVGILVWHLVLSLRYRPAATAADEHLPEITVVVPAFNEGRQVLKTLRSLMQSDYPAEKLHIVAVDDGSQDDTWTWMKRGAAEAKGRIVALRCLENRGKRAALYEGFGRASGSVVVTVDSDSEVLPDTLRNLVSPLVHDARVGAVAGNVRVLNREAGILPAMLDVSFTFSFQFVRAAQSEVDTVMCCPGALTAYRRDILEAVKDEWLGQTFFGEPSTIGEDRALTNLILRNGYSSKFQENAIVNTEVPTGTAQLAKMYLRWARSDVRETLVLGRFIFTKFRRSSAWGARLNYSFSALRWVLTPLTAAWAFVGLVAHPSLLGVVLGGVLFSALLPASLFALSRTMRGSLWAFPYAVYAFFCLWWIRPYALFTPHRSKWLTRQLPASPPSPAVAAPGHPRLSIR